MTVEHDRYTNSTTLYTYDNGGNLLQKAVYPDFYGANGTPTITNYTYGNSVWADQLTNYNGTAITYDNSGNPLNWRDGLSFTWQNGRQLASAANDTTSVAYTYNQNGIRTSKTINGVKTTYILDENDQLMGEVTGNNTTVFLYDENGTAYGFLYNNTPYFYLFNAQGDVMNVVDEAGTVVATYNYDAWGNTITATGTMATINPIRYRGYYYDAETELYYLQSRYYDARVCRFLNADDVEYLGVNGNVLNHNLFAYCENNPVVKIDPDGYAAFYVMDYDKISGLPVLGHAVVCFQYKREWYYTEYTGSNKKNAKVILGKITTAVYNRLFVNVNRNYIANYGTKYIYIPGDHSACYRVAKNYKDNGFGKYHLLTNNCLHYVQKVLQASTCEWPSNKYIKHPVWRQMCLQRC